MKTVTRKKELKMKTVNASLRFVVGDVVSWKSQSGTDYTGTVVSIKEGENDDLVVVQLANGQHRSFYDNATDWRIKDKSASQDSMVGFYQNQYKRKIWAAKVRRHARG